MKESIIQKLETINDFENVYIELVAIFSLILVLIGSFIGSFNFLEFVIFSTFGVIMIIFVRIRCIEKKVDKLLGEK